MTKKGQLPPQQAAMSPYRILAQKRDGKELSAQEIEWFIQANIQGQIPDYQMSALLMAFYIRGMSAKETAALTRSMLYSGKCLSFKGKNIIDKHSTGGIGDKTSFILAPCAASSGVKVPMIAGRALGHTGGTIDKIESIPGLQTGLSLDTFVSNLNKHGLVLMGQTEEFAPADKRIYALRDVTATVDSIPLITASIMSKKLAEGIKGLVLDIKFGNGAFMKNKKQAKALAASLAQTAHQFGVSTVTYLTDMSQPLGQAVGHSLEIIESLETLKGKGPKDLTDLSLELAGGMIYLAGKAETQKKGLEMAKDNLYSGKALKKFEEMIMAQGGDASIIQNYDKLPLAKRKFEVLSPRKGYIHSFQNEEIGLALIQLGGGRKVASDKIDLGVGFYFHCKKGDSVERGGKLVTIYHNDGQESIVKSLAEHMLKKVVKITSSRPRLTPLIQDKYVKWCKNA